MLSLCPRAGIRLITTAASAGQKAATMAPAAASQASQEIPPAIKNLKPAGGCLQVEWSDGKVGEFSYLWLKDSSPQKRPQYLDELRGMKPESMKITEDGNLMIHWPPYHYQNYTSNFLRHNARLTGKNGHQETEWDGSKGFLTVPYTECQKSPEKYGMMLKQSGLMVIKNGAGMDIDNLLKSMVDPKGQGRIQEKSEHTVTHSAESLHTYGPHLDPSPEWVSFEFHGKAETVFQLVDGMSMAEKLRQRSPEHFQSLQNCELDYEGPDGKRGARHPVFKTDPSGHLEQIVFNNHQRMVQKALSSAEAIPMYMAMMTFHRQAYSKENIRTLGVLEKDILVFNNRRILYGHSAFSNPCDVTVTTYVC